MTTSSSFWRSWPRRDWSPRPPSPCSGRRAVVSPREALLFGRILAFSVAVPAILRLGPARLAGRLDRSIDRRRPIATEPKTVVRLVDTAMRVGTPAVRPGCLTRGITLYYFLRRAGEPVTLQFGIGELHGETVGHCWLSKGGEPFLEARDPRPVFRSLYSFPAPHPAPAAPEPAPPTPATPAAPAKPARTT